MTPIDVAEDQHALAQETLAQLQASLVRRQRAQNALLARRAAMQRAQACYVRATQALTLARLEWKWAQVATRCLRLQRDPLRSASYKKARRQEEALKRQIDAQRAHCLSGEAAYSEATKRFRAAERWLAFEQGEETSVLRIGFAMLDQLSKARVEDWPSILLPCVDNPAFLTWVQEATIPGVLEELFRVAPFGQGSRVEEGPKHSEILARLRAMGVPGRLFGDP